MAEGVSMGEEVKARFPRRLVAAIKAFLWMCLFGGVLGPIGYYRIRARYGGLPMNVFEFTALVILAAYVAMGLMAVGVVWSIRRRSEPLDR